MSDYFLHQLDSTTPRYEEFMFQNETEKIKGNKYEEIDLGQKNMYVCVPVCIKKNKRILTKL